MSYTTTEPATLSPAPSASVLDEHAKGWRKKLGQSLLVLLIIFVASWYVGLLNFNTLANGVPAIGTLIGESLPPDFTNVASWVSPLIDTLAMSIAGTAIAVTLSVPLAFLAARNTSPHPVVLQVTRTLLNGLRSVPELIMGIIFVAAVGFGALPGVLALGLHSIGMVGKFFAEAIEHVDEAPVEAADAAGATRLQVLYHASTSSVRGRVHLSLGIQFPCLDRNGHGGCRWYWLRIDGLAENHAVSGSQRHSHCHLVDGHRRGQSQWPPS